MAQCQTITVNKTTNGEEEPTKKGVSAGTAIAGAAIVGFAISRIREQ